MATEAFLQQLMTNPDRLNSLAEDAKELALFHGIITRTHETPNSSEVGATTQNYNGDHVFGYVCVHVCTSYL